MSVNITVHHAKMPEAHTAKTRASTVVWVAMDIEPAGAVAIFLQTPEQAEAIASAFLEAAELRAQADAE